MITDEMPSWACLKQTFLSLSSSISPYYPSYYLY